MKETLLSTHKTWRLKIQGDRQHFYLFVWLLTYALWSRTNHDSKAMHGSIIFFYDCVCQVSVLLFSVCLKAFQSYNKLKIWCEIQRISRCHSLDKPTDSSEVQMSLGHTFRDCQRSDEPENSWRNTHHREPLKSMNKWREKTLANVKVSLVAFPYIFFSFHTENWGTVFSQETKAGQQCCRACHIDKVRSTWTRNRLQQLTALALWEFTHTNKSSTAEEVIIQCYLCWTMGLPIPVPSYGIVFLNNSLFDGSFLMIYQYIVEVWLEFTWVCFPILPPLMNSSENYFIPS